MAWRIVWLVVFLAALVYAVIRTDSKPAIVQELRKLPEVATVIYTGPRDAALTVIHVRDWHHVSKALAEADGLDYAMMLDQVEKVQASQLAILRHLIEHYGVRHIYSEGLSAETLPALVLRVDLLRDLDGQRGQDGPDMVARRRELTLTVGAPGRLLLSGEVEVLPLEDADALDAAKPVVEGGEVRIDQGRLEARRRAMVANLPKSGLAVIVLGGSHDLSRYLPTGTCYAQVTVQGYPGDTEE